MDEASVTDGRGMPILAQIADPFDYGGGHINPSKAAEPDLVYDIDPSGIHRHSRSEASRYCVENGHKRR